MKKRDASGVVVVEEIGTDDRINDAITVDCGAAFGAVIEDHIAFDERIENDASSAFAFVTVHVQAAVGVVI